MGAPKGNCNAAKSVAKCRANKGWYGKSGAKKYLRKNMSPYTRKQRAWIVATQPISMRKTS